MVIEFAEILQDLELKRARRAAVSSTTRRAARRSGDGARDVRVLGEDGGEARARPRRCRAGMVADALAVLAAAGARRPTPSPRGRSCARSPRDVLDAARGRRDRSPSHDLTTLVEAALIAAGYFDVAKALVLRRALPTTSVAAPTVPR